MTITTYKWSIEEYHLLIESGLLEGKSVELLDGEIVEMSPEREEHSYTNDDVAELLRTKLEGLAKIRESHPITLTNSLHSKASEPEPDIARQFVARVSRVEGTVEVAVVRLPKTIYIEHHPYPEYIYWLIEVSNKALSKDLAEKSAIYAHNDIQEYWVIDLVNKKLIVHTHLQNNSYSKITEYTDGSISPLAFPNLEIVLDRLLLF